MLLAGPKTSSNIKYIIDYAGPRAKSWKTDVWDLRKVLSNIFAFTTASRRCPKFVSWFWISFSVPIAVHWVSYPATYRAVPYRTRSGLLKCFLLPLQEPSQTFQFLFADPEGPSPILPLGRVCVLLVSDKGMRWGYHQFSPAIDWHPKCIAGCLPARKLTFSI